MDCKTTCQKKCQILYNFLNKRFINEMINKINCLIGNANCVDLLISCGALLNTYDCNFGTPLHAAVFQNQHKCVKRLLQAGANVNATKFHETPLHLAVSMNHMESAFELLRFGANTCLTNNQNKKPIDLLAIKNGPLYEGLLSCEKKPPLLQDLCRLTLVRNQSIQRLNSLYYLPQYLIDFINFDI